MSDTKTKSGFGIIIVAALALVAIVALPSMRHPRLGPDDHEEAAIITITFSPSPRSGTAPPKMSLKDEVIVEIQMNPEVQRKTSALTSGWSETYYPRAGQRLWVKASQAYGTDIGCFIVVNGAQRDQDRNHGPRSVNCEYTRAR